MACDKLLGLSAERRANINNEVYHLGTSSYSYIAEL